MEGEDGCYIFPGTHSKHVQVRSGRVVDFQTYMTGEFFGLLSEMSLLSGSVEKNDSLGETGHADAFRKGVRDAAGSNLLHAAFRVRTNDLFGRLSAKANFHYLSGLLIGTELRTFAGAAVTPAPRGFLCCGAALKDYYEKALETLELCERVHIFPSDWVDTAVVRGQARLLLQLQNA
jgi:2-dehydro-3-deoxygalactonokinase